MLETMARLLPNNTFDLTIEIGAEPQAVLQTIFKVLGEQTT
jgi:hypothetical protein